MIAPIGQCWINPADPLYKLKPGEFVLDGVTPIYHQDEPFLVNAHMKSCFYHAALAEECPGFPDWRQRDDKEIEQYRNIITLAPGAGLEVDVPVLPGKPMAARIGLSVICGPACLLASATSMPAEGDVKDGTGAADNPECLMIPEGNKSYFLRNCSSDEEMKIAATAFCS